MTKDELAEFTGLSKASVRKYFNLASKKHPQIAVKINTATGHRAVDYTLEECLYVLRNYSGSSPLLEILLEENFVSRNTMYKYRERKIKLSQDVLHFIFLYENAAQLKACANCKHCVPRSYQSVKVEPFCLLFESFLARTRNYNVYKDHCSAWEKSSKTPRLYLPLPKPQNLDIYLNRVDEGKTLGIPNEKFVASNGSGVVLLKPLETCSFDKKVCVIPLKKK